MKSIWARLLIVAVLPLMAAGAAATAQADGLKRLYDLDCGRQINKDQSRWTPGINEGKAIEFSNNCYLIVHDRGTLLWDTGHPDAFAEHKDGVIMGNGASVAYREKTLVGQIENLGFKPDQITYVALSHTHPDHTGNLKLFLHSKILMQKAEYEAAMKLILKPIADGQEVVKLEGDHDVFGDGSVTILSTPGHTPGHQSLLVKLPKTGAVILTGDAVHLRLSYDKRIVPSFNFSKDQSLASIERLHKVVDETHAQLWINHDRSVTATVRHAPEFYE